MDLVFFGIQGSGKGTQARRLAEARNYQIFEAGATLRQMATSGTELGKTVASFIDKGQLVPYTIIMDVVQHWLENIPANTHVLFDGIPRDDNQKREFDKILEEMNRPFKCVHLLLPEEEAISRLTKRAIQEGRVDDSNFEFIHQRVTIFKEKTLPVIQQYAAEGNMVEVDGNGTVDEVYQRLEQVLS